MSWQQRKQYKSNKDNKFLERPSDAYFISIEVAIQELGGEGGEGSLNPPPWVKLWIKNTLGGRGLIKKERGMGSANCDCIHRNGFNLESTRVGGGGGEGIFTSMEVFADNF